MCACVCVCLCVYSIKYKRYSINAYTDNIFFFLEKGCHIKILVFVLLKATKIESQSLASLRCLGSYCQPLNQSNHSYYVRDRHSLYLVAFCKAKKYMSEDLELTISFFMLDFSISKEKNRINFFFQCY